MASSHPSVSSSLSLISPFATHTHTAGLSSQLTFHWALPSRDLSHREAREEKKGESMRGKRVRLDWWGTLGCVSCSCCKKREREGIARAGSLRCVERREGEKNERAAPNRRAHGFARRKDVSYIHCGKHGPDGAKQPKRGSRCGKMKWPKMQLRKLTQYLICTQVVALHKVAEGILRATVE